MNFRRGRYSFDPDDDDDDQLMRSEQFETSNNDIKRLQQVIQHSPLGNKVSKKLNFQLDPIIDESVRFKKKWTTWIDVDLVVYESAMYIYSGKNKNVRKWSFPLKYVER